MSLGRSSIWILVLLWVVAMGLSINALMQDPTGDSFLRGMNRIAGFLSWQLAAAILALGLWFAVRPLPKGEMLRWLGRVPGVWSAILFAMVVVYILIGVIGAEMSRNAIIQDDRPPAVTVPAESGN